MGNCLIKPIEKGFLPQGLQTLTFGKRFNQPIKKDVLPQNLQTLILFDRHSQYIMIINGSWKIYKKEFLDTKEGKLFMIQILRRNNTIANYKKIFDSLSIL